MKQENILAWRSVVASVHIRSPGLRIGLKTPIKLFRPPYLRNIVPPEKTGGFVAGVLKSLNEVPDGSVSKKGFRECKTRRLAQLTKMAFPQVYLASKEEDIFERSPGSNPESCQ